MPGDSALRLELEHMTRAIIELSLKPKDRDMGRRAVDYGIVRGFLIGAGAPESILGSLDALAAVQGPAPRMSGTDSPTPIASSLPTVPEAALPPIAEPAQEPAPSPKAKTTRNRSDERRQAASDRMRLMRRKKAIATAEGSPPALPSTPPSAKSAKNRSWGWSGQGAESVPPLKGEATTYTDELGRKVTRLPPGYARGINPTQTVMPSSGG